jgi:hypothetical protein
MKKPAIGKAARLLALALLASPPGTARLYSRVPSPNGLPDAAGGRPLFVDDRSAVSPGQPPAGASFESAAAEALAAMGKKAAELGIGGVAVVAYARGATVQSWISEMQVFGRMKDPQGQGNSGANLLGIAYAKASEMADSLRNSGNASRPPMTGEYGWPGGVIVRTRSGFVIAAFSGGKSEDDVRVSEAGAQSLRQALDPGARGDT